MKKKESMIRISLKAKKELEKRKTHPRESFREIVDTILFEKKRRK